MLASPMQIAGLHDRLRELYSALEGLEEADFAAKLDDDPRAMLWEMMVAKLLREFRFELLPRKSKGPDFTAVVNGQWIAVEAICPGLGDPNKPDSVPELSPTVDMRPVPTEKVLLRIAGALAAKKEIFDRYRTEGIIPRDAACVVAISSQKIGQSWGNNPCAGLTATLGHGRPFAVFEPGTIECIREGFEVQERVTKVNGNPVSTLPFLDETFASISGVLYSDTSALGLPYDLIGDAHFINNPKAAVPIALGTIGAGHVYCTTVHADGGWSTEDITLSAAH
jgi:hypothetical protein